LAAVINCKRDDQNDAELLLCHTEKKSEMVSAELGGQSAKTQWEEAATRQLRGAAIHSDATRAV